MPYVDGEEFEPYWPVPMQFYGDQFTIMFGDKLCDRITKYADITWAKVKQDCRERNKRYKEL